MYYTFFNQIAIMIICTLLKVMSLCLQLVANGCSLFQATSVIIAHNRPSGTVKSAPQDIEITRKIKGALAFIAEQLSDHQIISEVDKRSVLEEGAALGLSSWFRW